MPLPTPKMPTPSSAISKNVTAAAKAVASSAPGAAVKRVGKEIKTAPAVVASAVVRSVNNAPKAGQNMRADPKATTKAMAIAAVKAVPNTAKNAVKLAKSGQVGAAVAYGAMAVTGAAVPIAATNAGSYVRPKK